MASTDRGVAFLDDIRQRQRPEPGIVRTVRSALQQDAPDLNLDRAAWPEGLDLEVLAEREPPRPEFIVPDWMPVGYATLLAGHGGVGKSGIALHLAVCIAAGKRFFGLEVDRRRVLYLSCEDQENVLHWRLARICAHDGVNLAALRGWLDIVDLVGRDCVLWERDPRTGYTVTPAYSALEERMRTGEAEVLIIDGVSDTFAGRENDRGDVKRFVNGLLWLVPSDRGAVLLIGHIAKPAASNGATSEGYSGSTGWHNSVRARWYLRPETEQDEEGANAVRTGELILDLQKTNHGRPDRSMRFRWDDAAHLFVGELVGESTFDRRHQDRTERVAILRALAGCGVAEVVVPTASSGQRTAFHVLSARPEFPDTLKGSGRAKTRRFWRQIEELRQSKLVTESSYRRTNRHVAAQFVITDEGKRQCVE